MASDGLCAHLWQLKAAGLIVATGFFLLKEIRNVLDKAP